MVLKIIQNHSDILKIQIMPRFFFGALQYVSIPFLTFQYWLSPRWKHLNYIAKFFQTQNSRMNINFIMCIQINLISCFARFQIHSTHSYFVNPKRIKCTYHSNKWKCSSIGSSHFLMNTNLTMSWLLCSK